ncbi:MAG: hypothetical protein IT558_06680, partial [Alphaproteobacteria bacterium]|nr:hypothetical protein [Alphaproteobacteria bacterium]
MAQRPGGDSLVDLRLVADLVSGEDAKSPEDGVVANQRVAVAHLSVVEVGIRFKDDGDG